jgi:hypothetical protein
MIEVLVPRSASTTGFGPALMRAFVAWHRKRHVQDLRLINAPEPGRYTPQTAELPE